MIRIPGTGVTAIALLLVANACGSGRAAEREVTESGVPAGVVLTFEADRTAITIGDPVVLTARLVYPEGTRIIAFDPESLLEAVDLLDAERIPDARLEDGRVEEVRIYRVTVFETGAREIPALAITYIGPDGVEHTISADPIRLEIASVLAGEDTEPADIKPPAEMPVTPLWPWLLAAATLLAAGFWVWRRRRRRLENSGGAGAPAEPARPAHEVAYAELERLLSSSLLNEGMVKAFYIELAEIIRRYVAARFRIDTNERTTGEILEQLRQARAGTKVIVATGDFFLACDLVKFARHTPAAEETQGSVESAYRLIDETRLSEPASAVETAA
ncbi:MAG: DUF4381 family protein [Acidobacteria bacterium]|nr:DUF4381 family protein [Acidobacteriota bacterium]